MRKLGLLGIMVFTVLLLGGCASEESAYVYETRKDNYIISDDKTVLIDYKTDEQGKLVELYIDRLLEVEDLLYYNTQIDYNYVLPGFTGEIFTEAGFECTDHNDLLVPINIEVGNIRYKYDYVDCAYNEVDRDNDEKTGRLARSYPLDGTIDVSRDTIVSIVVFDEDNIERFIEIQEIPTTVRTLGVYSIGVNLERDGFIDEVVNYYRDITIYEQLVLKHQESDPAVAEIMGISASVNLLEFDEFGDLKPLVESFETRYLSEIRAFEELYAEIGPVIEEELGEETEETEEPTDDA